LNPEGWKETALQATLQILTGPERGRRIHLKSGQVARFGRTGWSDFAFPYDAALADVHFSIETDAESVTLANLSDGNAIDVDGQKVARCVLRAGQRIRAGGLVFLVETEVLFSTSETGTGPVAVVKQTPPPSAGDLAHTVCEDIDLSEPARGLLDAKIEVIPYIDKLTEAEMLVDALRLLAGWMSKRKAVWWAAECVEAACGGPSQAQAGLVAHARSWAREPTEEHRRAAMSAGASAQTNLPACWIAQAAGWSGGSLAPAELPAVPPDEHLTSQAVTGALLLAAVFVDPAKAQANYRLFVDKGKQVAKARFDWES